VNIDEYSQMRKLEDDYWWFVARRELAINLLKLPLLNTSAKGLDLGCGTGALLTHLQRNHEVFGLDISPEAIGFCEDRGLKNLFLGSAEALPFEPNTFDFVVTLDTLEHVENDLVALKEIERVLKPGGIALINVPAFAWLWGPHDVALHHHRRYTRSQLRQNCTAHGLKVEKISYSVFFLFPVVVLRRISERLYRGPAKVRMPVVRPGSNKFLIKLMRFESKIARKFGLPWGSSLFCIVRKSTETSHPKA